MTNRTVPGSPDSGKLHPYNHVAQAGDIVVDVIRPRDLVALTVTVRGATLEPPGEGPSPDAPAAIVAGPGARLYVDFPFQHTYEQASYEISEPSLLPDPLHPELTPKSMPTVVIAPASKPARLRASRGSRLVFALPEGSRVEYSTVGILGAIPWLDAVLHPRGQAPGIRPPRYQPGQASLTPGLSYVLAGGLVAHVSDAGVVIAKQSAAEARAQGAGLLARREQATNARIVAEAVAQRGATLARGVRATDLAATIGTLLDPTRIPPVVIRRGTYSRKATLDETAIEAPFRLQISPTSQGRWVHTAAPAAADDATGNVELWHTRLDTGIRTPENLGRPGSAADAQTRVVRAVWTRDRDDLTAAQWQDRLADQGTGRVLSPDDLAASPPAVDPFLGSLDRADRHRLVRQSAEAWPGDGRSTIAPTPVGADRLWLTALGAWLEFHGQWTTGPYSDAEIASILAWDHIATGGRDQYVRVVYPGYFYPTGQPAVLVKLTERSIRPQANPAAGLYQRQFLIVIDPIRTHAGFRLPFTQTELSPLVTPNIDPPIAIAPPDLGPKDAFWPMVGGKPFAFRVDTHDREGRDTPFAAPLLWVAEHVKGAARLAAIDKHYAESAHRVIDLRGQAVAFTPKDADAGDARVQTRTIRLRGTARPKGSDVWMTTADVVLPAAQAIAGTGPTTITYYADYRDHGFTAANSGRVWAATVLGPLAGASDYASVLQTAGAAPDPTVALPKIGFGGEAGDVGSDKAGGFIQPNLTVKGLSTKQGAIGDLDSVATSQFDPAKLLGDALPKLFGLVKLTDILPSGTLDKAPALVTDALDAVTALVREVERAKSIAEDAVAEAERTLQSLVDKGASKLAEAQQLVTDAEALATAYADLVAALPGLIDALTGLDGDAVEAALNDAPDGIRPRLSTAIAATKALARPPLPLFARTRLQQLAEALGALADGAELASDLVGFLNGLDLEKKEITFRYEWKPELTSWPSAALPLLQLKKDSLVLAVAGTLKTTAAPKVEVLAELRDFQLNLFSKDPLMTIPFEHISFKAGSTGKAEIDVVIKDIVFGGFLEFVQTVKELIPLDGFSDPPFVDVTPAGLTAGFTLTLPNLAVGVFNLSNMSLGADVQVPFLGEALSVGFNFCTREKPFVLSVVFLGGGGWFLIRLSPKGLEVLELGLEAGAYLAVDFGVASGSISAAIGVYIRLEGEKGSLTGYFRLRGEVDVLGLISASIELYMELVYQFDTGKMLGRARITVEVEVLFFSGSVTIEAERQFAGSNGDPSLREVVMEPDGTAPAWDDYLLAFAKEVSA
ncbi:hypothetical protein [Microbacterium sp.]|uniref:hypothetical protein n=1 Tax=Microbacterium sp. TaxID=51671 RepID=UPI0039E2831F